MGRQLARDCIYIEEMGYNNNNFSLLNFRLDVNKPLASIYHDDVRDGYLRGTVVHVQV